MIQKLYNIFKGMNIVKIALTSFRPELVLLSAFSPVEVKDARSTVFEAFGILKMTEKPVAIIIDEIELSSTLTALTEAWFQRKDLVIVTINSNLYKHFDYLDRCVVSNSLLLPDTNEVDILNELKMQHGPHLIRTAIQTAKEASVDYSQIYQKLEGTLTDQDIVFFYHPQPLKTDVIFRQKNIMPQHKYCAISKYVGFCLGSTGRPILCIPERLLAYDSNIFNIRNLPKSFFVIVVADGSGYLADLRPWIESNGIITSQLKDVDFYTSLKENKPTLVYN